jgi:purine-binding chemotaxis protein CheW
MNLAEIRKKAAAEKPNGQKQALNPVVNMDPPESVPDDSMSTSNDILARLESEETPVSVEMPEFDDMSEYDDMPAFDELPESVEMTEITEMAEVQDVSELLDLLETPENSASDEPSDPADLSLDYEPLASVEAASTVPALPQESVSSVVAGKTSKGFSPVDVIIAGRQASEESSDQSGEVTHSVAEELEEYLCFRVASEEYAISIMEIKEIIKPREVTEVPRAPKFVLGVISLRGLIVPIMDMRARLSLFCTEVSSRERIVVIHREAGFCGLLVDEVIQVARIAKSAIEEPPAVLDGIDRAFVKGLGHYDSRMIILLDLETILDSGIH